MQPGAAAQAAEEADATLVAEGFPGGLGSVVASDQGAGAVGFVGTTAQEIVAQPCGLTTLAREFEDGPQLPMLPASWDPHGAGGTG
ncbi:MAG: hypothetical protein K2X97_08420 [Mycobacteriaceae bacterium]|nr:hypothetical protein [Mycobacteriaceae bacterium]